MVSDGLAAAVDQVHGHDVNGQIPRHDVNGFVHVMHNVNSFFHIMVVECYTLCYGTWVL